MIAPRIDGLALGELLGRGGFAAVWAARREADRAEVAVKVALGASRWLTEQFRREADALARVGPPHVPRLYAMGEAEDGRPYLAMERLFGRTLAREIAARSGAPHLGWAVERADAILAALEVAHASRVVHRDLKPENVFIAQPEDRAVLLDFGLTRSLGRAGDPAEPLLSRAGAIVGTPSYMAPEQIRGDRSVDERTDIYAFGVILFELLTLRLPFEGERSAVEHGHLALRPPRPGDITPVPRALEELALACLAKDPARRPESAALLRRALADAYAASIAEVPSIAEAPSSGEAAGSAPSRLISEGRHPVVLLYAEADGVAPPVIAAIARRGGRVVRQRGARYVAMFSPRDAVNPGRAAIAAARELVEQLGARAAVHLAAVTIRRHDGAEPTVYGAAIERPETWLPAEPWSGVARTRELSRALPDDEPAPFAAFGEPSAAVEPPMVGRDRALAALAEQAAAAFDGTCPALSTILGDTGLGKTRFATEAARIALRLRADAVVIALRASPRSGAPRYTARGLAEALRRRARGAPVAVIVDDAHWADGALLDALEVATLDGAGVRLWAVVIADPRFEQARRAWGSRSQRHGTLSLAPLDEASCMELSAALLLPAEYPPAEALRQLAAWSGGNPACLREIVRSLKRAGAVRRRPGSEALYLATAELAALPPSPAWQWLATRQLDALPPELAACIRLCSVLGVSFAREELEWVQDAVDREGGAGTPVDAGFGLSVLVERGVLHQSPGGRCAFQHAVFQDAVYEMIDAEERRAIHRHALAFWRARAGDGDAALEPLARHAAACGALDEAADAYLRLGDAALARHRNVEADGHYTAALSIAASGEAHAASDDAHAASDDAHAASGEARRRALALAGRGKSRYRIHRVVEARQDIAIACEIAARLGDQRLLAGLLLDDATALDWSSAFDGSARCVAKARPLIEANGDAALGVRLLVAEGRTLWRQARAAESMARLEQAIAGAAAAADTEPRVVALLMLSFQLACARRHDEAEARFHEVIALTAAEGDRLHLAAAYVNRVALWIGRREPVRAIPDLRSAIDLARETGNPWLECLAAHNMAVLLHWSDQGPEAIASARRALVLDDRFSERPNPTIRVLLASILLAAGEIEDASRLCAEVRWRSPPDEAGSSEVPLALRISLGMVGLVLTEMGHDAGAPAGVESWDDLMALAERAELLGEEMLELLYWRARVAIRAARWDEACAALGDAERRLATCPMWLDRFTALRQLSAAREQRVR